MEADCRQLAVETTSQNVQSHFVRMAGVWAALAGNGSTDTKTKKPH